ncbi:MAG: hypothetical protein GTO67_12165, partial [Gammaproteobacteria bacterium]|nr:hypothetical protein [Gammaproteobacteria bacterium]NIM73765.1 hypothetical protein [Gammaproteobacteria bacterium]NIN39342.1 hypothetical protein [Gammaproteobacteria bacterium]NIO25007.1 hypothetical protein [Gammaproteobacteria bacterium]NIO65639.1 hypothetical protein [Gammaproteobacteria bacterium]
MADNSSANRMLGILLPALFALGVSGCVAIPGEPDPNDPWEPWNRSMYQFNDGIDKDIIAPLADLYLKIP